MLKLHPNSILLKWAPDAYLGTFLATLETEGLLDTTDVVIVSDHGMDGYDGKTKENIVEGLDDVNDLEKGVEWGSYMSLQVAGESDPASVAASISNMMGGVQGGNSIELKCPKGPKVIFQKSIQVSVLEIPKSCQQKSLKVGRRLTFFTELPPRRGRMRTSPTTCNFSTRTPSTSWSTPKGTRSWWGTGTTATSSSPTAPTSSGRPVTAGTTSVRTQTPTKKGVTRR